MSPCNNVCKIDPITKLCIGCKRTIEEISQWGSLSLEQRSVLMKTIQLRNNDIRNNQSES